MEALMRNTALILLLMTLVLSTAGCGGKHSPATFGAIRGKVVIAGTATASRTLSVSGGTRTNFAKTALRRPPVAPQTVGNERLIKLRPDLSMAEAAKLISGFGGKLKKKVYGTAATYVITVDERTFSSAAATRNANVEYVDDNLKVHAFAIPNDPYYTEPYYWNYNLMQFSLAWDLQKGSAAVVVAVIDTGVAPQHPDLSEHLVAGYDFVDDDAAPWDLTYYNEANRYSHGTHVAGIIGAVTDNGVGIAGVAWNVRMMPIRALGPDGSGSFADVAAALNWAVEHGADIINLSFGVAGVSPEDSRAQMIVAAIDNAIDRGVTVVAAAGNYANTVCFPANYKPVLAVAALDETGAAAAYSGCGAAIDICAPGGGESSSALEWNARTILSTCYDKKRSTYNYTQMYGTSMAAPHIAGLAALLYSQGLTNPAKVEAVIENTAISLGNSGVYGAGKANAYAALFGNGADINVFYYNLADSVNPSQFYQTKADLSYKLVNLTPGSYKVCAFIDNDGNDVVSDGDMVAVSDLVSVTAGKINTVNLMAKTVTGIGSEVVNNYFQKLL
jgi:serine protease